MALEQQVAAPELHVTRDMVDKVYFQFFSSQVLSLPSPRSDETSERGVGTAEPLVLVYK